MTKNPFFLLVGTYTWPKFNYYYISPKTKLRNLALNQTSFWNGIMNIHQKYPGPVRLLPTDQASSTRDGFQWETSENKRKVAFIAVQWTIGKVFKNQKYDVYWWLNNKMTKNSELYWDSYHFYDLYTKQRRSRLHSSISKMVLAQKSIWRKSSRKL